MPPPINNSVPTMFRTILYKKPFPFRVKKSSSSASVTATLIQAAYRCRHRRSGGGKTLKIMFPHQNGGRFPNLYHIEEMGIMVGRSAGGKDRASVGGRQYIGRFWFSRRTGHEKWMELLPACPTIRSGGKLALRAAGQRSTGIRAVVLKLTTCPLAWTPASVRPAAINLGTSPVKRRKAFSNSPWTVRSPCACRWYPEKSVPS